MAQLAVPLMAIGTVVGVSATLQEGRARREMANTKAAQLEEDAGQAIAISQHEKEAERKKKNLIASRALALSAASGGASDITSINLMADIEGEGALRESIALYKGEEEARKLRKGAAVTRRTGQLEYAASKTRALATAISGGGSIAAYKSRLSYG